MRQSDPAHAGQAPYSSAFLRIYDPLILGFYGTWRGTAQRPAW